MASPIISLTDPGEWLKRQQSAPTKMMDPGEFLAAHNSYSPVDRGNKMKGEPKELPDTFMGTITKDFAGIPGGAVNAISHPVDTVVGAFKQLLHLPGYVLEDVSQGKWGKLGARLTESALLGLGTDTGAALASKAGSAIETGATVAGGALKAGAKAAVDPKTMVGAGTAEYVASHVGIPHGVAGMAVAAPRIIKAAIRGGKEALQSGAEEALSPGELEAGGREAYASLSADDQAILDHIAQARQNLKQAAPPKPPANPTAPPAEPPVTGQTIGDVLKAEMDAKKAPEPHPLTGATKAQPISNPQGVNAPLRPPLATQAPPSVPRTEVIQPKAPVVPEQTAGQTITARNVDAKAERIATALDQAGIDHTIAGKIQQGRLSMSQIQAGETPRWGNVIDDLTAKGILPPGEEVPNQSMGLIITKLRQMNSRRYAEALRDEMAKDNQ